MKYYSTTLNEIFDTEKELLKAEAEEASKRRKEEEEKKKREEEKAARKQEIDDLETVLIEEFKKYFKLIEKYSKDYGVNPFKNFFDSDFRFFI